MMKLLKGLIAATALAIGVASATPQDVKLPGQFDTVTVVTSCSEIVVAVITTNEGKTFIVDASSGIPADALKRAISVSDAQVRVYEIGCYTAEPEIRT